MKIGCPFFCSDGPPYTSALYQRSGIRRHAVYQLSRVSILVFHVIASNCANASSSAGRFSRNPSSYVQP